MGTGAERRDHCYGEAGDEGVRPCLRWTVCFPQPKDCKLNLPIDSDTNVGVAHRLISIARGEQQYFDPDGIPTATEGCKSNALMRCCKDLGIASELWDPRFIRRFLKEHGKECVVEHQMTKKRRKHFMRKDDEIRYPFKEVPMGGAAAGTANAAAARK